MRSPASRSTGAASRAGDTMAIAVIPRTGALLLPLLLSVTPRRVFIQTSTQRIEIVGKLPRSIQVLLGTRTICTARTLLSGLKLVGKVVQTFFDRTFIGSTTTLLPVLLTILQRLLAFANTFGNAIADQFGQSLNWLNGSVLSFFLLTVVGVLFVTQQVTGPVHDALSTNLGG